MYSSSWSVYNLIGKSSGNSSVHKFLLRIWLNFTVLRYYIKKYIIHIFSIRVDKIWKMNLFSSLPNCCAIISNHNIYPSIFLCWRLFLEHLCFILSLEVDLTRFADIYSKIRKPSYFRSKMKIQGLLILLNFVTKWLLNNQANKMGSFTASDPEI